MSDEMRLFRRITHEWVVKGSDPGTRRLSSNAFRNTKGTDSFSVALEDTMKSVGRTPEGIAAREGPVSSWRLTAGFVRSDPFNQHVQRSPKKDEPEHGDVVGEKPKSLRSAFAEAAEWIVPPDGLPAE